MELQKRQEVVEQLTNKLVRGEPFTEEEKELRKRYDIKLAQKKSPARHTDGGQVDCDFEEIAESQLLQYLKAGWSIVEKLSNGQVIVKNVVRTTFSNVQGR